MMKKRIIFNYLKPQHYYNRLLTFFSVIAVFMSFSLFLFSEDFSFEVFLLNFVILFFLLLFIAVFVELFSSGEYISAMQIYNLELFFNEFLSYLGDEKKLFSKFFNKYDVKSRKKFLKCFGREGEFGRFFLSSIRREGDVYVISFISNLNLMEFYLFKFFFKPKIYRLYVKEVGGGFRIVRFS